MNKILLLIPLLFIVSSSMAFSSSIDSPKHQLESGIAPENVICKENLVLTIRTNGQPACVTERTADKLNWKIIPHNVSEEIITPEIHESGISIVLSNERIITHSSSVVSNSTSSFSSSMTYGCPTNLPTYTIDTPSQVPVGEEFDIIIDYSYVIPDVDAGYEDPDEIFDPSQHHESCLKNEILIRSPSFVKILDQHYVNEAHQERWDMSPPVLRNEGVIPYEFDNTGPQQEIITMKIEQPRFGDQIAELYISPGNIIGVTRTIAIHDGMADMYDTDTKTANWSADDYTYHESMLANIRSNFALSDPIPVYNQTWVDQNRPDLGYNPTPPQGNPPDMDDYATWLLQLPFPNEMRYQHIVNNDFPQPYLDELFVAYPELLLE